MRTFFAALAVITVAAFLPCRSAAAESGKLKIGVSFPSARSQTPLDGRVLLMISKDDSKEPRFQIKGDGLLIFTHAERLGHRLFYYPFGVWSIGGNGITDVRAPRCTRTAAVVQGEDVLYIRRTTVTKDSAVLWLQACWSRRNHSYRSGGNSRARQSLDPGSSSRQCG